MGLQLWMPLTSNVNNLGLLPFNSPSWNNLSLQANGKLGKCYSGLAIYHLTEDFLNNTWSLCAWVKSSSWSVYNDIILCKNTDTSTECQFYFSIINGATLNLGVNAGSSSVSMNYTFATDTWYHVAATYNGSIYALYIDGILKKTGSLSTTLKTGMNNIGINCRSANAAGTILTGDNGKRLNDVRIYDYALSAKEVEELSKGLVLHYKLDDIYSESTTNLCNNLKSGGRTVLSTNPLMITTTGENADTYWYVKTSSALVGGNTYTLSLQCSGLAPGEYFLFGIGALSGANNCGNFAIYNGYNEKTFTLASGLNGVTLFILDDNSYSSGVRSKRISFYNVLLEAKDHATGYAGVGGSRVATTIYDSSGYSNNGTIVDSLEIAIPSPRYSVATSFNGSTSRIEAEPLPIETKTISAWLKWNTIPASSPYSIPIHDKLSGLAIGVYQNGAALISYVGSGAGGTGSCVSTSLTTNTWYHIVVIKTGDTTRDVYVNGVKATPTSNNWWGGDLNKLELGCRHYNAYSGYFNGQIVDFRAYATVLTPEQIKELYNTSMSIDNNGNIHARELVEL